MAKAPNGPHGPITGKIGNLSYYILNGEYIVRSIAEQQKRKKTPKVIANEAKFACVQNFCNPLKDFLAVGFKKYGSKRGGMNAAVSYALKHAVSGSYPDFVVNPDLARVSGGELYFPAFSEVILETDNQLRFTWDINIEGKCSGYDQAMLLAYNVSAKKAASKVTGAFRMDGTDVLTLPKSKKDQEFEVYLGFVSQDRTSQAHSVYLGKVLVPKK